MLNAMLPHLLGAFLAALIAYLTLLSRVAQTHRAETAKLLTATAVIEARLITIDQRLDRLSLLLDELGSKLETVSCRHCAPPSQRRTG